jgi:hypothetical protein
LTFIRLKNVFRDKFRHKKTGTDNSVAGFTIRSLLSLVTNSDTQFLASTCSFYPKDRQDVKLPIDVAAINNLRADT